MTLEELMRLEPNDKVMSERGHIWEVVKVDRLRKKVKVIYVDGDGKDFIDKHSCEIFRLI